MSGGTRDTTNNRMELTAVIECLLFFEHEHRPISIYSDSSYVVNGITKFIKRWREKGWIKVKNPDLWKKLDELASKVDVSWHWVKAHADNEWNNRADLLAKSEATKFS